MTSGGGADVKLQLTAGGDGDVASDGASSTEGGSGCDIQCRSDITQASVDQQLTRADGCSSGIVTSSG